MKVHMVSYDFDKKKCQNPKFIFCLFMDKRTSKRQDTLIVKPSTSSTNAHFPSKSLSSALFKKLGWDKSQPFPSVPPGLQLLLPSPKTLNEPLGE